MKFIQIIFAFLLIFATFVYSNEDVTFTKEKLSWWPQQGTTMTKYAVKIQNNSDRDIYKLDIGVENLSLRYESDLFNIIKISNEQLQLPNHRRIEAHDTYTFFLIQKGSSEPNFSVKSVEYID